MVKLGLDTFSYHLHLEDVDHPRDAYWFLKRVVDLGLDGCHFDPRHLRGWDEGLVRSIGRFCEAHGLYLELGCGGFDYARVSQRLALAASAGARMVRTFIGGERHKVPEGRRSEVISYTIENFKRLGDVAEHTGVVLALQNHEDLTSGEVLAILAAVDNPCVRACVDNANALCVWEDPVECVRNLIPYLSAAHLKDWKHHWQQGIPVREGCALGRGDASVGEVYSLVRGARPDLPITLKIATIGPGHAPRTLAEEHANVLDSIGFIKALQEDTE